MWEMVVFISGTIAEHGFSTFMHFAASSVVSESAANSIASKNNTLSSWLSSYVDLDTIFAHALAWERTLVAQ
jgi:hypothetical protein